MIRQSLFFFGKADLITAFPNLSDVISIVALLFSIFSFFKSRNDLKKFNTVNMEVDFYKDIFFVFLIEKIPAARQEISYSEGIYKNVDQLILELNTLRKRILFFKYKDEKFYNKLVEKLQNTENFLVEMCNPTERSLHRSLRESDELNDKLEEIYQFILYKYYGRT